MQLVYVNNSNNDEKVTVCELQTPDSVNKGSNM